MQICVLSEFAKIQLFETDCFGCLPIVMFGLIVLLCQKKLELSNDWFFIALVHAIKKCNCVLSVNALINASICNVCLN